jgi:20S proteasome alpha/beta subunit
MTIIVTAKVTDGVVLAADSAATFGGGAGPVKIYNNANKIFNLVKVWPIGVMVYGAGGIGSLSVETLSKDLRKLLSSDNAEYGLNRDNYTIEEVAWKARRFLFEETYQREYPNPEPDFFMGYRIAGYSAGMPLPEIWEFAIVGAQCAQPHLVQGPTQFGLRWAGQNEALDRLLLGMSGTYKSVLTERGLTPEQAEADHLELVRKLGLTMVIAAMPIQDAIDVSRFLVDTAVKFTRYTMRAETVGGPIELAAITKHEGFKWVSRKHYYSTELNREIGN